MDYYVVKRCDNCNSIVHKNSRYCNKCGSARLSVTRIEAKDLSNNEKAYLDKYQTEDKGSFALGFILVFFLNFIGLIIALTSKKEDTKNGAYAGLLTDAILIFILMVILIAL